MTDLFIPLFPLEVVLLPGEVLPLHIFEERYKQMIAECLDKVEGAAAEGEFGILWVRNGQLLTVGCTASVVQVLRRYDDGRLDILTVGRRRFEILFTNEDGPYLRGAVAFFGDEDLTQPSGSEVSQAKGLLSEVLQRLDAAAETSSETGNPFPASFDIAARLPLGLAVKQQLLETRNEPARLRQVIEIMNRLIPALDFRRQARHKASGNGEVNSEAKPL